MYSSVYIDGMYMSYKGLKKSTLHLGYEDGDGVWHNTCIIYNFFSSLLSLKRRNLEAQIWGVIWDISDSRHRLAISPSYKERDKGGVRKLKALVGFNKQVERIKHLLQFTDIIQYWSEGYEADDVIATLVKENCNNENLIVANDKDLYQLLDYADMYDFTLVKDRDWLFWKYGVFPEQWVDVQALAGDRVDNVESIRGIGIKSASKMVRLGVDVVADLGEADREKVEKARALVTLLTDVPYQESRGYSDREALAEEFREMCFSSFSDDDIELLVGGYYE